MGREPGRFASSTRSCSESSLLILRNCVCGDSGTLWRRVVDGDVRAVRFPASGEDDEGGNGCEMAFCPVITVPSFNPAEI